MDLTIIINEIRKANIEGIQQCIKEGVDVNQVFNGFGYYTERYHTRRIGYTLLAFAIECSYSHDTDVEKDEVYSFIIKTLINAGADVNRKFAIGDYCKMLSDKNFTALSFAVSLRYYKTNNDIIVQTLIDYGADVNIVFNDGMTGLMKATANGDYYTVRRWLSMIGVNVFYKTKDGKTALDIVKNQIEVFDESNCIPDKKWIYTNIRSILEKKISEETDNINKMKKVVYDVLIQKPIAEDLIIHDIYEFLFYV
jgi:hypothetical protein